MGVDVNSIAGVGIYISDQDLVDKVGLKYDEDGDLDDSIDEYKSEIIEIKIIGSCFTGETDRVILIKNLFYYGRRGVQKRIDEFINFLDENGLGGFEIEEIKEVLWW